MVVWRSPSPCIILRNHVVYLCIMYYMPCNFILYDLECVSFQILIMCVPTARITKQIKLFVQHLKGKTLLSVRVWEEGGKGCRVCVRYAGEYVQQPTWINWSKFFLTPLVHSIHISLQCLFYHHTPHFLFCMCIKPCAVLPQCPIASWVRWKEFRRARWVTKWWREYVPVCGDCSAGGARENRWCNTILGGRIVSSLGVGAVGCVRACMSDAALKTNGRRARSIL